MITYNGKALQEFGVYIDDSGAHNKPLRSYETVSILGRDGELTYSNNRFENVELTFKCLIKKDFAKRYAELVAFLQSEDGYNRLELGTEREFYRMAYLSDIGEPDTGPWAHHALFELTFDCMPQRWYKSGENVIENPSALVNPSYYAVKPLIRCYGAGVLKVGSDTITISEHSHAYIDIDCDLQDCYCGAVNCNNLVTLNSSDFPALHKGKTGISFTGTKFEVTPRWWTI